MMGLVEDFQPQRGHEGKACFAIGTMVDKRGARGQTVTFAVQARRIDSSLGKPSAVPLFLRGSDPTLLRQ